MSFNIVFMGTPEFSVPTLDLLIKNKFNVVKVYTQPPKKSKRGQKINPSPIEGYCKKNKEPQYREANFQEMSCSHVII